MSNLDSSCRTIWKSVEKYFLLKSQTCKYNSIRKLNQTCFPNGLSHLKEWVRKVTGLRFETEAMTAGLPKKASKVGSEGKDMLLDAEKREQNEPTLDIEWLQLVLMAREIGLSTEEVRLFLQQKIEHSV